MTSLPPIISPTKKALRSFLEKKEEELKRLNERLAFYIKKVKTLEASNSQLTADKKILEESNKKLTAEVTITKTRTETEIQLLKSKLEDANRMFEEIVREKARLQNENRKLADEYKKKEGQLVALNQEIKNLEAIILELKKECQELKDASELAKYSLEQETLGRMDLENKLQSKKAELVSLKKTHEKDMVEIRRQLRIAEAKRFDVVSEMKTRYEEMLAQQQQELRNELEISHKSKYDELQQMYTTAVAELTTVREERRTLSITVKNLTSDLSQWQSKCDELQQMCANNWQELSNVREENENLKSQIVQWQSKNASLVLRIEDLEKLRVADQRRAAETIAKRDADIEKLHQRITRNHEYDESLMVVNNALDSDIKDYKRMIEDEENRLNINRRKRRRIEFEGTACIQIEGASIDGKFVKLFNSGSKDFPLGGWSVERSVDGEPPVIYKFTSKYVLKSGSYVTIWASKGGGQHKPPTDLVFKQKASWGVGKETKTVLRDSDGQEAASEVHEEVTIITTDKTDNDVDGKLSSMMMEDEESFRLNTTSPGLQRMRRRVEVNDYSNEGWIQIEEANTDGKFVKLFNRGSEDFPLGGWSVERSVDGEPPVIYKFTPKYVLKSGSYVTIWASQGGGQHKSPTDLVFKQKASWGVGKETKTVLRDSDGQEAASEVYEEVTIIRTDETDTQEAATLSSEEVSVISRTDETGGQAVTSSSKKRAGDPAPICTIQ